MKIGVACRYTHKDQEYRSIIHSDNLIEILKSPAPTPLASNPGTSGTLADPHRNLNLANWYYLSTRKVGAAPIFYKIGGRTIARWGSGGGQFVDYATDITGIEEETSQAIAGGDYEQYIRDLGKAFKASDSKLGIKEGMMPYTRKALRIGDLDDVDAASLCRSLLGDSNTDCSKCPEIAASACALFICEAHRCPATFVISLMLLDLVQTRTTYGKVSNQKTYTWKSMLMHGVDGGEIPGRGSGVKELGKHPMAGVGTVVMANNLFNASSGINLVRDRVISILSVWVTHYLQKKYPQYKYYIVSSDKPHAEWTEKRADRPSQSDNALKKACTDAVKARCAGVELLIGGTTVSYESVSGAAA